MRIKCHFATPFYNDNFTITINHTTQQDLPWVAVMPLCKRCWILRSGMQQNVGILGSVYESYVGFVGMFGNSAKSSGLERKECADYVRFAVPRLVNKWAWKKRRSTMNFLRRGSCDSILFYLFFNIVRLSDLKEAPKVHHQALWDLQWNSVVVFPLGACPWRRRVYLQQG